MPMMISNPTWVSPDAVASVPPASSLEGPSFATTAPGAASGLNHLTTKSDAKGLFHSDIPNIPASGGSFHATATAAREADYDLQHVVDVAMQEQSFRLRQKTAPLMTATLSQRLVLPQWAPSCPTGTPVSTSPSAGGTTILSAEEINALKIQNSPTPCLWPPVKLEAGRPTPFPEIPPTPVAVAANMRRPLQVREKIKNLQRYNCIQRLKVHVKNL